MALTDAERQDGAIRELRILGDAIRGNWGTLDGRTVRDTIGGIISFMQGHGDDCQEGRTFYHYNNTVYCGLGRCDERECPVCREEGRYE